VIMKWRRNGIGEAAQRSRRRWSDIRLWSGVAVLIVSMFLGARIVAGDEAGTPVWRTTSAVSVGGTPTQLEIAVIDDPVLAQKYVSADQPVSGTVRWPISAGELIPLSSLAPLVPSNGRLVTVPVDQVHMPVDLAAGDRVDVWATSESGVAMPIAQSILVEQVSRDTVGMGGKVAVVIRLAHDGVASVVTAVRSGDIDLVSVPVDSQVTS